jgi:signal transduction histidine kinase
VISGRYPVTISPMKIRDATTDSAALVGATGPALSPDRDSFRRQQTSRRFVLGAALGVGIASFLATELMRDLLVPDIGRARERLLAEGLSALIVSCLTAKLVHISRERHRLMMARMQVIAEMNHHIRNALSPISLSVDGTADQLLKRAISESVDRIDWALREILPREIPLGKEQRHKLGYFQRHENPLR